MLNLGRERAIKSVFKEKRKVFTLYLVVIQSSITTKNLEAISQNASGQEVREVVIWASK